MAALVAPDLDGFVEWTDRGVELAEADAEGSGYWLGPLYNILGWAHYDTGAFEEAVEAFRRQVVARELDPGPGQALEIARYALGKALRALGRSAEAVPLLEGAVAWAESEGARTDGSTRNWRRSTRRSAATKRPPSRRGSRSLCSRSTTQFLHG